MSLGVGRNNRYFPHLPTTHTQVHLYMLYMYVCMSSANIIIFALSCFVVDLMKISLWLRAF